MRGIAVRRKIKVGEEGGGRPEIESPFMCIPTTINKGGSGRDHFVRYRIFFFVVGGRGKGVAEN